MYEMVIYGVSFDLVGKQPIVLLKTADGNKFLPIWIGHPEAAAILMKLQGANTPRPMTHDLISEMLSELEVSCTRVAVTELRENTFYAEVTLQLNGREIPIDSRPSDALALAVRNGERAFGLLTYIAAHAQTSDIRARAEALGVAQVLNAVDATSAEIQRAARTVLSEPGYRRRAELIRDEIDALPGPGHAVELIEQLSCSGS